MPIVVAVNKIDLPDANPDRVKSELAAEGLQPEEWGGTTQFSRSLGEAEAEPRRPAREGAARRRRRARADGEPEQRRRRARSSSRGSTSDAARSRRCSSSAARSASATRSSPATRTAGCAALFNYRGEKVKEASPGEPVEIIGFDKPPPAGEHGRVVENERQARHLAQIRAERLRREQLAPAPGAASRWRASSSRCRPARSRSCNLVLKGDVQGSVEAARQRAVEDPALRGARQRHPPGRRRDHRERRHARRRRRDALVVGFNVRPERRGARARRARGRRDPHLPRHLPADRGHRAGARRHARRRSAEESDRRGGGAGAVPGLAPRHDRRLHGHPRHRPPRRAGPGRPRRHGRLRDDDRALKRFKDDVREVRRASSAASCSTASTTSRKATCSRCTRRARSSAPPSTSSPPRPRPSRTSPGSSAIESIARPDASLATRPLGRCPASR